MTGTSVVAVKFNGGVAIATDNLGMLDHLLYGNLTFLTISCVLQHRTGLSLASPM